MHQKVLKYLTFSQEADGDGGVSSEVRERRTGEVQQQHNVSCCKWN